MFLCLDHKGQQWQDQQISNQKSQDQNKQITNQKYQEQIKNQIKSNLKHDNLQLSKKPEEQKIQYSKQFNSKKTNYNKSTNEGGEDTQKDKTIIPNSPFVKKEDSFDLIKYDFNEEEDIIIPNLPLFTTEESIDINAKDIYEEEDFYKEEEVSSQEGDDEEDFSKEGKVFSKEGEAFSKEEEAFSNEEPEFSKEEEVFSKEEEEFSKEEEAFSNEEDGSYKEKAYDRAEPANIYVDQNNHLEEEIKDQGRNIIEKMNEKRFYNKYHGEEKRMDKLNYNKDDTIFDKFNKMNSKSSMKNEQKMTKQVAEMLLDTKSEEDYINEHPFEEEDYLSGNYLEEEDYLSENYLEEEEYLSEKESSNDNISNFYINQNQVGMPNKSLFSPENKEKNQTKNQAIINDSLNMSHYDDGQKVKAQVSKSNINNRANLFDSSDSENDRFLQIPKPKLRPKFNSSNDEDEIMSPIVQAFQSFDGNEFENDTNSYSNDEFFVSLKKQPKNHPFLPSKNSPENNKNVKIKNAASTDSLHSNDSDTAELYKLNFSDSSSDQLLNNLPNPKTPQLFEKEDSIESIDGKITKPPKRNNLSAFIFYDSDSPMNSPSNSPINSPSNSPIQNNVAGELVGQNKKPKQSPKQSPKQKQNQNIQKEIVNEQPEKKPFLVSLRETLQKRRSIVRKDDSSYEDFASLRLPANKNDEEIQTKNSFLDSDAIDSEEVISIPELSPSKSSQANLKNENSPIQNNDIEHNNSKQTHNSNYFLDPSIINAKQSKKENQKQNLNPKPTLNLNNNNNNVNQIEQDKSFEYDYESEPNDKEPIHFNIFTEEDLKLDGPPTMNFSFDDEEEEESDELGKVFFKPHLNDQNTDDTDELEINNVTDTIKTYRYFN